MDFVLLDYAIKILAVLPSLMCMYAAVHTKLLRDIFHHIVAWPSGNYPTNTKIVQRSTVSHQHKHVLKICYKEFKPNSIECC